MVKTPHPKNADECSEKEIAERMDRALKNIASTPPKPFTPKPKREGKKSKRAAKK